MTLTKLLVFWGRAIKTIAGSYMRVKWMVEDQKLGLNLHQNTLEKPTPRAINWCNNIVVVPVWNNTFVNF